MNARTLIESRHLLWSERLRTYTARLNAGETHEGRVDLDTLAAQATAVVDEIEHLASTLDVDVEPRGG